MEQARLELIERALMNCAENEQSLLSAYAHQEKSLLECNCVLERTNYRIRNRVRELGFEGALLQVRERWRDRSNEHIRLIDGILSQLVEALETGKKMRRSAHYACWDLHLAQKGYTYRIKDGADRRQKLHLQRRLQKKMRENVHPSGFNRN